MPKNKKQFTQADWEESVEQRWLEYNSLVAGFLVSWNRKINAEFQEKQVQEELKRQQLKQELETKQQSDESKFLIENTGEASKCRNSSKQIIGKTAAQEESCKSLEIGGEKHDTKLEKKRKMLNRKIMKLKIKMVNDITQLEKSTGLENDETKRMSAERCFLALLFAVLVYTWEEKIEERCTAFNQKRKDESLSREEIENELAAILVKKQRLAKYKDIVNSMANPTRLKVAKEHTQISVSKDQLLQQIIECTEEQLKKCIDNYSEEQLDSKFDEVSQEFESNEEKFNKWVEREFNKQFQKKSSYFLSYVPPEKFCTDIAESIIETTKDNSENLIDQITSCLCKVNIQSHSAFKQNSL